MNNVSVIYNTTDTRSYGSVRSGLRAESETITPMHTRRLPGILFVSTYPPRECGIATYSHDLIKALNHKFGRSFSIEICPLESGSEMHTYTEDTAYVLNTDQPGSFMRLANSVNNDDDIAIVLIQHEFGLFTDRTPDFINFLETVTKPVIVVFHTVLPDPDDALKENVVNIAHAADSIIVMTQSSAKILSEDYGIIASMIDVIPHGTHLVPHSDKELLKEKYGLSGRKILSTFGLLNSGKSIETSLEALPAIIKQHPEVLFLIIGKTHPSVVKQEGEKYRESLEATLTKLGLQQNVRFINSYLTLPDLLEYLQLTDIYLFTSKDPNQAVSGTFSYAISCGCPVISTPIPHVREVLGDEVSIIIDFGSSHQLAEAAIKLLSNDELRKTLSSNGLHIMASTAWENTAIAHAIVFEKIGSEKISLEYSIPAINLCHVKKMTTGFGMIQFSKLNQPDIDSGYTLDDNARALIACCQHLELTGDSSNIDYIRIYFSFIRYCQQPGGAFLNYVCKDRHFTDQNKATNLADSNGRAIWALGYLLSMGALLPRDIINGAESVLRKALAAVNDVHSTRAMAFIIKGIYYYNTTHRSIQNLALVTAFADRLVQMYRHEAGEDWEWYESYLTYANSILPEALLCAWLMTGKQVYKEIATTSFNFLLSKIFRNGSIHVVSNKGWLQKWQQTGHAVIGGEQPIDVAYTILALSKFYEMTADETYLQKMTMAFNWFLGNNHLHQIIYNPCTGGCYDGLEENYVNLNQGAESTLSYLMARLVIEKTFIVPGKIKALKKHQSILSN